MEVDPLLSAVVVIALLAICLGVLLKQMKQPYVIGYIFIGILIGVFENDLLGVSSALSQFGNLGIVLLLFFIGLHISVPKLVSRWRVAVLGTIAQVIITVGVVWGIAHFFAWPIQRILLIGFVISLSSTAVVLKILHDRKELSTKVGQNVLGVLLAQDLLIIPMIIALDVLGGKTITLSDIALQVFGGILMVVLVAWTLKRGSMRLPFTDLIEKDHELQVFLAILLCFGLSLLTGWLGLSTALGAFLAGFIVASSDATHWVQEKLDSFHIAFVAVFFIYVGTLIDITFLREYARVIILLLLGAFILNTAINALILRVLGDNWKESIYAGGLLSQIGEFSFLLGIIGYEQGIISSFGYQLTVSIIALSLLFSPLWIMAIKKGLHIDANYVFELPKKIKKMMP